MLYTAGCPLACPYCHNPELTQQKHPDSFLPRREVLDFLARRRGFLEGIVITGGEPCLHLGLGGLIQDLGKLGFAVKLDSSGVFPANLARLLSLDALDFVALDIKTAPDAYRRLGGSRGSGAQVLESLGLLRAWKAGNPGKGYQLRTVCAPGLVDRGILEEIQELLLPGEDWVLTRFRPGKCLDPSIEKLAPLEEEIILSFEAMREGGNKA